MTISNNTNARMI